MKTTSTIATTTAAGTLALALLCAAHPARACGEGQFNMGQGMRYQGYLAPKPATVLVFDDSATGAPTDRRGKLYLGLEQAGHHVTVVSSQAELTEAMANKRFDVVIADFAQVDALPMGAAGASAMARVLPVVERRARNQADLRSRFPLVLVDGASLGQYLKVINQAVTTLP